MKSWKLVAKPHADVLSGRMKQSDFAADLAKVAAGTSSSEYSDPEKFFARTYLTKGLVELPRARVAVFDGVNETATTPVRPAKGTDPAGNHKKKSPLGGSNSSESLPKARAIGYNHVTIKLSALLSHAMM